MASPNSPSGRRRSQVSSTTSFIPASPERGPGKLSTPRKTLLLDGLCTPSNLCLLGWLLGLAAGYGLGQWSIGNSNIYKSMGIAVGWISVSILLEFLVFAKLNGVKNASLKRMEKFAVRASGTKLTLILGRYRIFARNSSRMGRNSLPGTLGKLVDETASWLDSTERSPH